MSNTTGNTELLAAARAGDRNAFDHIFGVVYEELRQAAHQRLLRHRPGETLNTTALVHEAYLRLVDHSRVRWGDRAHFLALASRAMRYVLIDHSRARMAQKRAGREQQVPLDAVQVAEETSAADLLSLNEALDQLSRYSPRLGQLIEYRFFGGLTHEEIAEIMEVSVPTVKRDWARARTWLFRALQESGEPREG